MSSKIDSAAFFDSPAGIDAVNGVYGDLGRVEIEGLFNTVARAVGHLPSTAIPLDRKLRILDAGCGTGNKDPLLADAFKAEIIAATPFQSELDHATAHNAHSDVTYIKSGMPVLDGIKAPVDIVYSNCAFQYITDPEDRLQAWKRFAQLAPSGVIALNYPDRPTLNGNSVHPDVDALRKEIESCKGLKILFLDKVADPLIAKRDDPDTQLVEVLVQIDPENLDL